MLENPIIIFGIAYIFSLGMGFITYMIIASGHSICGGQLAKGTLPNSIFAIFFTTCFLFIERTFHIF